MVMQLGSSSNADRDLTSLVEVWASSTPNAIQPVHCKLIVDLGDGTKDLDQSADSDFYLDVLIGSQMMRFQRSVFATVLDRQRIETDPFIVPANTTVVGKVWSPNPNDSDVDVTARLYQVDEPTVYISGTVSDAGPTATDFDGDSSLSATDDIYNNCWLGFLDGPNQGLARLIRDYTGASKNFAFTGDVFPGAPGNGNRFIIWGNAPA